MHGSPGSSLIAVNRQTAKLRDEVVRLQAALSQERQLHAATRYREELLQSGGARLVERAALADELAEALAAGHWELDDLVHNPACPTCALLARHAATKRKRIVVSESELCNRLWCQHPLSEHKRDPLGPSKEVVDDGAKHDFYKRHQMWQCTQCNCASPLSLDEKRRLVLEGGLGTV